MAENTILSQFKRFFHRLRQPPALLHPRLLLNSKDRAHRLHRALLLNRNKSRPHWQWWPFLMTSMVLWYGFNLWRTLFISMGKPADKLERESGIPRARQFRDLLYLGVVCGISPGSYYHLCLYSYDRSRWLNFVYPQEVLEWHRNFSFPPAKQSASEGRSLLADKYRLARNLEQLGLQPSAADRLVFRRTLLEPESILVGKSLFLKPNIGSAMRGCLSLCYDASSDDYELVGKEIHIRDSREIISFLQRAVNHEDYLVQDLLCNHPTLSEVCEVEDLVTIRAVSGMTRESAELLIAILEVPRDDGSGWWLVNIDCESGELVGSAVAQLPGWELYGSSIRPIVGKKLPCWTETLQLVAAAHGSVPGLRTVGWDLAITPDGPMIIEGNSTWGVIGPQVIPGIPMLEGSLADLYFSVMDGIR